jgi:hypothetical protein
MLSGQETPSRGLAANKFTFFPPKTILKQDSQPRRAKGMQ